MGVGCGVEGRVSDHEGVSYSLYIYCAFDLFAGKIRPVHTFYEMLQIRERTSPGSPAQARIAWLPLGGAVSQFPRPYWVSPRNYAVSDYKDSKEKGLSCQMREATGRSGPPRDRIRWALGQ